MMVYLLILNSVIILNFEVQLNEMTKQKNTDNKKLHSKLMEQKKNKKKVQKEKNKARIREMNQLANQKLDLDLEN